MFGMKIFPTGQRRGICRQIWVRTPTGRFIALMLRLRLNYGLRLSLRLKRRLGLAYNFV